MQASTKGRPVSPASQAASRAASGSRGRRPSQAECRQRISIPGSSSSFWMKWSRQASRAWKERRLPLQPSRSPRTSRCRSAAARAASRTESVPSARCGESREQAASPPTGVAMALR
jgi:hypothetical protein